VTALLENSLGAGSIRWFDVIAAGDVVPAKKPAPDIYRYALDALGLSAEECLAVEDSRNGLRAALGADLATLVTRSDYTAGDDFTGARMVVSDLGEPDAPMQVIAGDAGQFPCVSVALLKQLIGQSAG
jgi:beta-phosphoglucomutase-like phosphatase (HAD superfamily)